MLLAFSLLDSAGVYNRVECIDHASSEYCIVWVIVIDYVEHHVLSPQVSEVSEGDWKCDLAHWFNLFPSESIKGIVGRLKISFIVLHLGECIVKNYVGSFHCRSAL